jgi:hypothetical protein
MALNIKIFFQGEKHPDIGSIYNNFGLVYIKMG